MVDFLDAVALVLSILGMVTVPLYFVLLRMLYSDRKRGFSGPFYRLFLVLGIIDILSTVNNFAGVSLPGWGLSIPLVKSHGPMYSRIYLCIAWFTRGTSSVLIAGNRALALMFPIRYARISKNFSWQYVIQLVPGGLIAVGVAFLDSDYVYFPTEILRQATPRILDEDHRRILYLTAGGCEIFQAFVIVLSYFLCICKLSFRKSADDNFSKHEKNYNSERAAQILGIAICTTELFNFAYMIFSICFKTDPTTYFSVHSCITDLYSLVNCYFIIFISKAVKRRFWASVTCGEMHKVSLVKQPKSIEISSRAA